MGARESIVIEAYKLSNCPEDSHVKEVSVACSVALLTS